MKRTKRISDENRIASLDVLRIILCLFVIVLHFNNSNGGAALKYTEKNLFNHEFALFCESFSICAVDVFLILSGYFLIMSQWRGVRKPVFLIMAVMGTNSFFCIINMAVHNTWSLEKYVKSLIPINYFVWLYIAVYLISPWINIIFRNINKRNAERMLTVSGILFSVYPTLVDTYSGITGTVIQGISTISATDSGAGYTLVNFIFMYCIGAYIRLHNLQIGKRMKLVGYFVSVIVIFAMSHYTMNSIFYCNTAVIVEAIFLFMIFRDLKIPNTKVITKFSGLTFSIYIIHAGLYDLWKWLDVGKILTGNWFSVIFCFIFSVSIMYICSASIAICGKWISYPVVYIIEEHLKWGYKIDS